MRGGTLVLGVGAGAVALLLGLGLAAAGCSTDDPDTFADVRITGCSRDAGDHRAIIRGEVHNQSSKQSNYAFQVDVKANDSKIETALGSVVRVDPGTHKTFTIRGIGADVPTGTKVTCQVAHVARVAST